MPIPFRDIEERLRLLGYLSPPAEEPTIEMPEDYVGAPPPPPQAPPPVDSDLAGSPAYQSSQEGLSGAPSPEPLGTTTAQSGDLSDPPVTPDAVSGAGPAVPPTQEDLAARKAAEDAAAEAAAEEQRRAERAERDRQYHAMSPLQKARLNSLETKKAADSGLEFSMAQAQAEAQQERDRYAQAQEEVARQRQTQARMAAVNEEYEAKKAAAMAQYQQSVEDMVAATPDPDSLLGGRGTWGRAVVLALRANASSLGAPQVASLIDQNLQMELSRQQSKFESAKDVVGARGGALKALNEQQESASKAFKDQHAVLVEHMAKSLEAAALRMNDRVMANKTMAAAMALRVKQGDEIGKTIELEGQLMPKPTSVGAAPLPPVILPRGAWGAKNSVVSWGPEAERAYQQYVSNENAQYRQKVAKHGAAARTAATASATSGGVGAAPRPVTPVATGVSRRKPAAVKSTPAEQPTVEANQPQAETRKYKSQDEWFEANAPTTNREDQKRFYFIDGRNGNGAPPIEFATTDDAKKFKEERQVRSDLRIKLDKARYLVEKLRSRGFFTAGQLVKRGLMDDPQIQEAISALNKVKLSAKEVEKLGVLTGNDWEILGSVYGDSPVSWQDPGPQFKKALEDLDDSNNVSWTTYAPAAAEDRAYNDYRNLPGAPEDWKAGVDGRGKTKKLRPEEASTDPESTVRVDVRGNPSSAQRKQQVEQAQRNAELQPVINEDQVGPRGQLIPKQAPQVGDFEWRGKGDAARDAFTDLANGYVGGFSNAKEYVRGHDPAHWAAFAKERTRQERSLVRLFKDAPALMARFLPKDVRDGLNDPTSVYRSASRGNPAANPWEGAVRWLKANGKFNDVVRAVLASGGV